MIKQLTPVKLAVLGNPITHSKSPQIFNFLMEKNGIEGFYSRILVDNIEDFFEMHKLIAFDGINITSPFKHKIYDFAHHYSSEVKKIKVGNLWNLHENKLFNTDIFGISEIIKSMELQDRNFVLLGAGSTAKSTFISLSKNNISALFNRSVVSDFFWKNQKFLNFEDLSTYKFSNEVVISLLPFDAKPPLNLTPDNILIDANYKNPILKKLCLNQNSQYIDGVNWLIWQAIKGFEIIFGNDYSSAFEEIKKQIEMIEKKNIISFVGFPASGKTTIARKIADLLQRKFVDLDEYIEKKSGEKISSIFQKGEMNFRNIERICLKEILSQENIILSCGGGVILQSENRELLKKKAVNILLLRDLEKSFASTKNGKRPLIEGMSYKEFYELFEKRKGLYFKTADLIMLNTKIEKCVKLFISQEFESS